MMTKKEAIEKIFKAYDETYAFIEELSKKSKSDISNK